MVSRWKGDVTQVYINKYSNRIAILIMKMGSQNPEILSFQDFIFP